MGRKNGLKMVIERLGFVPIQYVRGITVDERRNANVFCFATFNVASEMFGVGLKAVSDGIT